MDYIDKNDILNEKQFGFRSNHSTNMAIIELVDKVTKAVEKNESTLGIFLDLSKAAIVRTTQQNIVSPNQSKNYRFLQVFSSKSYPRRRPITVDLF